MIFKPFETEIAKDSEAIWNDALPANKLFLKSAYQVIQVGLQYSYRYVGNLYVIVQASTVDDLPPDPGLLVNTKKDGLTTLGSITLEATDATGYDSPSPASENEFDLTIVKV